MLPTPSVSRRRICASSVRYPNVTSVAAIILLVSCLYHIRGFVPLRSQASVHRTATEDLGIRAPVDDFIRGDDAHILSVDGVSGRKVNSHADLSEADVGTIIREREAMHDSEDNAADSEVLRQEDGLPGILAHSDDTGIDDGHVPGSKIQTVGTDTDTVSGSPAIGASDREEHVGEESVREDVPSAEGGTSEKENKFLENPVEEGFLRDKYDATKYSETLGVGNSDDEESLSGTISVEEVSIAEKEVESIKSAKRTNILEGARADGAPIGTEVRDETESLLAQNSESLETAEKVEEIIATGHTETMDIGDSEKVVTQDADTVTLNSEEKLPTDELESYGLSVGVERENKIGEPNTSALSGGLVSSENSEVHASEDSAVRSEVDKTGDETEDLSLSNAEKLEFEGLEASEKDDVEKSEDTAVRSNVEEFDEDGEGLPLTDAERLEHEGLDAGEKIEVQASEDSAVRSEADETGDETEDLSLSNVEKLESDHDPNVAVTVPGPSSDSSVLRNSESEVGESKTLSNMEREK